MLTTSALQSSLQSSQQIKWRTEIFIFIFLFFFVSNSPVQFQSRPCYCSCSTWRDVCWRSNLLPSNCNMTGKVDIKSNYTFDKCLVSRSAGRSHNHLSTAARDCQANSGQTREPEPSQDSASQQWSLDTRRYQQGTAGNCQHWQFILTGKI